MFDGVGWAAGEIVVFMLIATLIGFAIGWIFGRWLQKDSIGEGFEADLATQHELARKAEMRLDESNKKLEKVNLDLQGEQTKAAELSAKIETAKAAVGELEAQLEGAAEKDAEIARLAAELAATADLEAKLAKAGDLETVVSELKADLDGCSSEREEMSGRLARLEEDLVAAGTEREGLVEWITQLEGDVAGRDEQIVRLEAELQDVRAVAAVAEEAIVAEAIFEETIVAQAAVDEVVAEETAIEEAALGEIIVAEGIAEEALLDEAAIEEAAIEETAGPEPSKEEGLAAISEIARRTAAEHPIADDDLKKVHGIGPKLERTLKGLGITSFRQIANFEPRDVVYVTAALGAFKGRIERDAWMSSAAEQHAKKYNEPV